MSEPVRGPVVVVVDHPGGPMDRLVSDPDVTTFLNDRFHPIFQQSSATQPVGTIAFFTGCGCPLAAPTAPIDPAAFIALANTVIVRTDATACVGESYRSDCGTTPGISGAGTPGSGL